MGDNDIAYPEPTNGAISPALKPKLADVRFGNELKSQEFRVGSKFNRSPDH